MLVVNKLNFKEALDFVKCAISKDENRPLLTGIHLFIKDNRLTVEAVDGFRVMQTSISIDEHTEIQPFDYTFSYNMQMKANKRDVHNLIQIDVSDKIITFTDISTNQAISYPVIQGEFFNTEPLWPGYQPDYTVSLNPKYLAQLATAYKDDRDGIMLKFYGDHKPVIVVGQSEDKQNNRAMVLPLRK